MPKSRQDRRPRGQIRQRTHEVEETTRKSYAEYARVHLFPAFGAVPVGRVTASTTPHWSPPLATPTACSNSSR